MKYNFLQEDHGKGADRRDMTDVKYRPGRTSSVQATDIPEPSGTIMVYVTEGGDLVSTWVAKPEVHAEDAGFLVNPSANYSCQRRQLRTRRLITGRMLSGWSRVYASRFPREHPGIDLIES